MEAKLREHRATGDHPCAEIDGLADAEETDLAARATRSSIDEGLCRHQLLRGDPPGAGPVAQTGHAGGATGDAVLTSSLVVNETISVLQVRGQSAAALAFLGAARRSDKAQVVFVDPADASGVNPSPAKAPSSVSRSQDSLTPGASE
jgi:hypothetical protein